MVLVVKYVKSVYEHNEKKKTFGLSNNYQDLGEVSWTPKWVWLKKSFSNNCPI